jgi:hypothetical protein
MAHGIGLGRTRTQVGKFLDVNGLTQGWLERHTGISQPTMTRICGDVTYLPSIKMQILIVRVLQDEVDPHVDMSNFW